MAVHDDSAFTIAADKTMTNNKDKESLSHELHPQNSYAAGQ